MKTKAFFPVLTLIFLAFQTFSQSGESGFKQVNISGKKNNPPVLTISAGFNDNNGNNALDAGEKGSLTVRIKNSGNTEAEGLKFYLTDKNNIGGMEIGEFTQDIGNLSPVSEKNIEIEITGLENLENGKALLHITVDEADGFNAVPFDLELITRQRSSPLLAVTDHQFTTETEGKIILGKTVDLNMTVMNKGDGKAMNVRIAFTNPEKVFPAGNKEFNYAEIKPGEKIGITYTFLPNEQFTGNEIAITTDITEKTGKFGISKQMTVALDEQLTVTAVLTAGNKEDMIYRGGGDPLKGLNVANEKKEMQLGDYYALIIGIDDYKGAWTSLKTAVRDAKSVEKILAEKYKFDYFRVLYNEQATRKQILKEFEWLVANVKQTDNVFIYYSGHGEYKKELDKGYWVPADAVTTSVADFISNADIQTFLSGIRSKHTLLVADACFSGDIFRGKTVTIPFENSTKYYAKVHGLSSRKAISSGGVEPVMDGGRDGHSVFAYYLLKALDGNENKFYDASQLYENIKIPVVNNSDQMPDFHPIKNTGDEGGQFIFIKK